MHRSILKSTSTGQNLLLEPMPSWVAAEAGRYGRTWRSSGHGPGLQEGLRVSDKGRPARGRGSSFLLGEASRGANTECTS